MKNIILVLSIIGLLASNAYSKRNKPIGTPSVVKFDRVLFKNYYKELLNLSQDQLYWLSKVYKVCSQFDLQNTCVAIAWEESKFNRWGDNEAGDYGLMGINLFWFMKDNELNYKNKYRRIEVRTKLIRDNDFNLAYAIKKLRDLRELHGKNWKKIWGCYNGGTMPNFWYAKRIYNRILAFRKWKKSIEFLGY